MSSKEFKFVIPEVIDSIPHFGRSRSGFILEAFMFTKIIGEHHLVFFSQVPNQRVIEVTAE